MESKPEGFGGWLILVQIYLYIALMFSISIFLFVLIGSGISGEPIPGVYFLLIIPFFIGSLNSLILFYKKSKKFKSLILIYTWIFFIIELIWTYPDLKRDPLAAIIFDSIFILVFGILTAYILKSERVKNTFIN